MHSLTMDATQTLVPLPEEQLRTPLRDANNNTNDTGNHRAENDTSHPRRHTCNSWLARQAFEGNWHRPNLIQIQPYMRFE